MNCEPIPSVAYRRKGTEDEGGTRTEVLYQRTQHTTRTNDQRRRREKRTRKRVNAKIKYCFSDKSWTWVQVSLENGQFFSRRIQFKE